VYLSALIAKKFLLLTTDINKENIYCDLRRRIFDILNKFLHEFLFLYPIIILITFFCILKTIILCDEFPLNVIP